MQQRTIRRIWKTRGSVLKWLLLLNALIICGWVYAFYRLAIATQAYPGAYNDPFREFGIVAYAMVLLVTAYTLRRRFIRNLPGRVQDWLWLHVWFGMGSVLIACMHENFQNITHDFSFLQSRFTEANFGTTALYALILLVLTGLVGRVLDIWQARVISREAASNGVGITRSIEEKLFELELAVERLSAGKSAVFKHYCEEALDSRGRPPSLVPALDAFEMGDFQRVYQILGKRWQLEHSLQRQKRAQLVIHTWRYVHIPLACAALAVISYHSISELWKMLILHQ
ncbi:MAG TPA: ferric reductase-like transmembrane domain-containing protein [Ktedonobacteraceae bacterium]